MPLPFCRAIPRPFGVFVAALAALCTLSAQPAVAEVREPAQQPAGWVLEQDVATPSYALAEPASSEVNIDTLVLSCEQGPSRRGLQLRLYLTGDGPLAPKSGAGNLKDDPALQLVIDGVSRPVQLLFADDFVVLADSADGALPLLSNGLVDSLQAGRQLELRFDLVNAPAGQAPAFSKAVVDLQAGAGGKAVAALRRCGNESDQQVAQSAARVR
jgi:hypothetical protein